MYVEAVPCRSSLVLHLEVIPEAPYEFWGAWEPSLKTIPTGQRRVNFPVKSYIINILGFEDHMSSLLHILLCCGFLIFHSLKM